MHLESCLEGVDRGEDYAEAGGTGNLISLQIVVEEELRHYHRDAKMVLMGEGRSLRYEFDCSKARIPALAAVSPNLETGPIKI